MTRAKDTAEKMMINLELLITRGREASVDFRAHARSVTDGHRNTDVSDGRGIEFEATVGPKII